MSHSFLANLSAALAREPAVLVHVFTVQGSGPREVGAMMAVTASQALGTIGGGHLEWDAIAHARDLLSQGADAKPDVKRYALGPSLGQCCGGVVQLAFERIKQYASWPQDAMQALHANTAFTLPGAFAPLLLNPEPFHVSLFGGGHVGHALTQLLGTLPCRVSWLDSRDEIFPTALPANVRAEHSAPVEAAVHDLHMCEPQTHVLIMSFSHAEDLEIVAACLRRIRERNDLPYVGLIGSKTKWATFKARLCERGYAEEELARITCPIGIPSIGGKEPATIALAVAAQLFGMRKSVVS